MSLSDITSYRLTQYSHGAGCGCKIAPKVLDQILAQHEQVLPHPGLLVGNAERDDAAVLDLGDGTAIISTTDFFMPIVDDAATFGRIASVNAISDIYAMGGSPLLAIAILGWPVEVLPASVANEVVEGSRRACAAAGIPLAGGHSIDSPEPIFGLAVTGRVRIEHLKRNGGARPGDQLYLSKPLGVGIMSSAQKKGLLRPQDADLAIRTMTQLNQIGEVWGQLDYVHAMTDVTGFGLLGHLNEMCEASDTLAYIHFNQVPLLDAAAIHHYLSAGAVPGGTHRNWDSYGHKIGPLTERQRHILCDPQTSGGLLVAIDPTRTREFEQLSATHGYKLQSLGQMQASKGPDIRVLVE